MVIQFRFDTIRPLINHLDLLRRTTGETHASVESHILEGSIMGTKVGSHFHIYDTWKRGQKVMTRHE